MKSQILNFTEAFPPAHKATEVLLNADYRKHYNSFMNGVQTVCAFIAVIATLISQKWQENDMTDRCQIWALNVKEFLIVAYAWIREIGIPAVKNAATQTYSAGRKIRQIYDTISSPLFINL